MFGLGAFEIAIVAFIALIFIGPKKLPELAKSMGKFMRDFQDAIHGINQDVDSEHDEQHVEQTNPEQHTIGESSAKDEVIPQDESQKEK